MCDCEFCKRISDIQCTINRYQYAIRKIDGLDSDFITLSNQLELSKLDMDVYMKTEYKDDIGYQLSMLDDDMKTVSDSIRNSINNKISNLCNEKINAENAARLHHEEEEKKRLSEQEQEKAN